MKFPVPRLPSPPPVSRLPSPVPVLVRLLVRVRVRAPNPSPAMAIDNTVCADDQLTHIAIAQLGNDAAHLRGRGEQVNRRNDSLYHELRIVT